MASLKQKAVSGIAWSSLSNVGEQFARFVITVILARMLSPNEFGLIGMIMVFTGFAALFSNFGFTSALIQRDHVDESHYSSIFWLNFFLGILLCLIIIGLSPVIARFYNEPILKPLTMLIASTFVINSLNMVQQAILNREMKFKIIALRNIISTIVAGVIAILLAIKGFGVWSLAWKSVISSIVSVLLLWFVTGWRPRFIFKLKAIKELFSYSINYLGSLVINYWMRNSDNMLIGKYMGNANLGIYSRAYALMFLPLRHICGITGRVMFPVLSRKQNDKNQVKHIYLRTISSMALIMFPLMLGMFVVADNFILALYGPKWIQVIPILRILSLLGLVQSMIYTCAWIFTSQGRTDLLLRWMVIQGILIIGSIVLGIWIGTLMAVVSSYAIMSGLILVYPNFAIPGKLINMSFFEVIKRLAGIFCSAAFMALLIWVIGFFLPKYWPDWLCLILKVTLGIFIYMIIISLLKLRAYLDVRKLIQEQWERKISRKKLGISTTH